MPRRAPALPVLALLVAGCLPGSSSTDTPPPESGELIIMQDMAFVPDTIEVPPDTPLTVRLTNEGGIVHDLVFDDAWTSGEVQPGRSVEVELPGFTGAATGWCTVPGHRDAGMELTVTVAP